MRSVHTFLHHAHPTKAMHHSDRRLTLSPSVHSAAPPWISKPRVDCHVLCRPARTGFLVNGRSVRLPTMTLRLVIPSRGEVDGELSVERPWWQFSVRFNVAISQSVPIARMHEREREGVVMRWGLALKSARGDVNQQGYFCEESERLWHVMARAAHDFGG